MAAASYSSDVLQESYEPRADGLPSRAKEWLKTRADGPLSRAKEWLKTRAGGPLSRAKEWLKTRAPQHNLEDVDSQTIDEAIQPQHNLEDVNSQTIDEAIQNLPLELREKIYKEFVSRKIRERKEMGWKEVKKGFEVAIKLRKRREIGWNEVHNDVEGAPFFACDNFYYTDDYLSNFDREEIHNVDPDVLEQLLDQPFYEEEQPQQNLVDVDRQNMSLQDDLDEIDPEDLQVLMVDYLITNPEDLVEEEEELKKDYPAIMEEITKNKHAILPLCRKLLRKCM